LLRYHRLPIRCQRVMLGEAQETLFFLLKIKKRTNSFRFEKKVGDQVEVDEVVMQIETDKTSVGVPAPGSGIIEEIYVADGDTVKSGQQLFKMKITGEAPATKAAPAQAAAAPPPKPSAPAAKIPVAAIRHEQANEEATVKLPPVDYSKDMSGTRTEQRVKMNRMRLKIASRLKEAQNTNAMLTTLNEVDMRYD
jgi:2-oxoglutarate dehydrogenase E2 component (dihydrolipoamide succinyltransferase)